MSKTTRVLKVDLRPEHAGIAMGHAVVAMDEETYSVRDLLNCSETVNFCEFDCAFVMWQFDWKLIGLFLAS